MIFTDIVWDPLLTSFLTFEERAAVLLSLGSTLFMGELLTLQSCCFSFWTEDSRSSRGLLVSRNELGFEEG